MLFKRCNRREVMMEKSWLFFFFKFFKSPPFFESRSFTRTETYGISFPYTSTRHNVYVCVGSCCIRVSSLTRGKRDVICCNVCFGEKKSRIFLSEQNVDDPSPGNCFFTYRRLFKKKTYVCKCAFQWHKSLKIIDWKIYMQSVRIPKTSPFASDNGRKQKTIVWLIF